MSEVPNQLGVPPVTVDSVAIAPRAVLRAPGRIADLMELGKLRLSVLVALTTLVGFVLASPALVDWPRLAWTIAGTLLAALGANAFNELIEAARDARMRRTQNRPLPARRLTAAQAAVFASACGLAGPALLLVRVNAGAAALALATLLLYVLVYTPMKVRTPWNTFVGAVVGAIPPLIGWAAATGTLAFGGWVLAAILFFWQMPHFFALAWLYRDDYARGGFRMLPAVGDGLLTFRVIVVYTVLLIPVTLILTVAQVTGGIYAAGAFALGLGLLLLALRLAATHDNVDARRVFLASVLYLPLLLGLMVFDRVPPANFRSDMSANYYGPPPLALPDTPSAAPLIP